MILVIDNYDSFTYNLVHYIGEFDYEVLVKRNDEVTLSDIRNMNPEKIVISPGPCTPKEAGISVELVQDSQVPLLGVCLGHQSIGAAFGAKIVKAPNVFHGKKSEIRHSNSSLLYKGIPDPYSVVRYHSLIIDNASLPKEFALHNNYPNPFNPVTNIVYDIPEATDVTLEIYNVMGQRVRTLAQGNHEPGRYQIVWSATNDIGQALSSGMYIYRIQAGDFVSVKKLVLMK